MENLTPLFISYFYPPAGGSGLPGSQRSVKFIRYLQHVESIFVLSVQPESYPDNIQLNFNLPLPVQGEIIERTELHDRFQQAMEIRSRLKGWRKSGAHSSAGRDSGSFKSVPMGNGTSIVQRLKDFIFYAYYFPDPIAAPWLRPAVKAGLKLVRENKINIIFATGMPWTALVVGRLISKKTGVPFIADFRDPWLGNPFLQSKGRLLDWREQRCEKKIVTEAALISANTMPLQEEFLKRYPFVSKDKCICLPNGFDSNDFKHLPLSPAYNNIKSKKLVLAHAGFLYGKRDPAPLLEALELLSQRHPELAHMVEFLQMGGVTLEYDFGKRFGALIDKGIVKVLGQVPYKDCLARLAAVDILVIIQPGTKTQVPSKLYDYLCINRHILTITPLDGALGHMIRDNNFGDLFEPDAVESIVGRLVKLCEMKKNDLLLPPDYPGREKFDVRHIARQLEDKIKQIVASAS